MKRLPCFLDGRLVYPDGPLLETLIPGRLNGPGVFETMAVYDGHIFAWDRHMRRLLRGLKFFKLPIPYSPERLRKQAEKLIVLNRCPRARLRVSVWKEGRRLRSCLLCRKLEPEFLIRARRGYNACLSSHLARQTPRASVKAVSYQPFAMAALEAAGKGCDEALLLNSRGYITEGTRTNLFFVEKDCVYTPLIRLGALNGVTRGIVLKLARQEGIKTKGVRARPARLLKAREAFVTNALIGITPLLTLDGRLIAGGQRGPVTARLSAAYHRLVARSL